MLLPWRLWSPNVKNCALDFDTFYAPTPIVAVQMWASHLYADIRALDDQASLRVYVRPEASSAYADVRLFVVTNERIVESEALPMVLLMKCMAEEFRKEVPR